MPLHFVNKFNKQQRKLNVCIIIYIYIYFFWMARFLDLILGHKSWHLFISHTCFYCKIGSSIVWLVFHVLVGLPRIKYSQAAFVCWYASSSALQAGVREQLESLHSSHAKSRLQSGIHSSPCPLIFSIFCLISCIFSCFLCHCSNLCNVP